MEVLQSRQRYHLELQHLELEGCQLLELVVPLQVVVDLVQSSIFGSVSVISRVIQLKLVSRFFILPPWGITTFSL